jgi:hypothetical protein
MNAEGVPDELYDQATELCYRVLAGGPNPPVGTLPTDTSYFEPFDVSDRYILLDQPNQTPIGDMLAVFDTDPRVFVDPDNVAEIAEALVLIPTKRHPLGILQDPQRLHVEVIAAYGYARFVEVLATHLAYCGFSPKGSR